VNHVGLEFSTKEFSAAATIAGQSIEVVFRGNADMRAVPGLEDLVPKIHAQAQRMKVAEVAVDMGGLEFMNSSCFRVFVNWLNWVRDLMPEDRYIVRFRSAPGRHWQRPSLSALACFASEVVRVDNIDID
jgi:anti-anti-sigma factor